MSEVTQLPAGLPDATLASALKVLERFSPLCCNRKFQFERFISFSEPCRVLLAKRRYSTPETPSKKRHDRATGAKPAAISLIENLVPERPTNPTTKDTKAASSDALLAEFVAEVRKYDRTSPTANWRQRSVLSQGTRYNAEGGESTRKGRHSPGWSQEIVFQKKLHGKLLEPPYQERFKDTFDFGYVVSRKMRSYVQVLTTPTADTPGTTLLLHFDNKRYLIGSMAEGSQRACVQMGAGLRKVSECFLTGRTEWKNTGGLLGMILTLADSATSSYESSLEEALLKVRAKAKREGFWEDVRKLRELEDEAKARIRSSTLTLFGPPNLNHTLATARRFIFRKGMPVNVHEIRDPADQKGSEDEWAPYWADDNIKVWAMSIKPDVPTQVSSYNRNGTVSPRKRSFDEVDGHENGSQPFPADDELSPGERDQLTVKAVVSEMFNSSWRLDTLHETSISHVRMPATIFIRNAATNKVERYHGPLPGGEQPLPDPHLKVLVRQPWPGALVESLPETKPATEAISYIIRNHLQRGKFNPKRAIELKVEKGSKWGQLSSGLSVTNSDGETITPDMVLGESKDGGGLAVVDVPDASYIDNLISRPEWTEPKVMAGVGAVFWICGNGVVADPRVQEFMKRFGTMEHIVSSPECCPNYIAMDSSAAATIRLRKIDPIRYRVPVHDNVANDNSDRQINAKDARLAARGQIIQLEPSFEVQQKYIVDPISIPEVENEMSQDVLEEAAKAHQLVDIAAGEESLWAASLPGKDAEIITLGTGSALPSKYRNVSATLVRVPGWGNILFDCGENTLGQLKRVFTQEELRDVIRELKIIFISHMHADHHLGTVGVIKAWYEEVHSGQPAPSTNAGPNVQSLFKDQNRVAIISEPAMLHWLMEYTAIEDYGFSRLAPLYIIPAERLRSDLANLKWFVSPTEFAHLAPEARNAKRSQNAVPPSLLGLQDVQAVAVKHCHGALAFAVTLPSGFKVSYSGDCRPSKAFARIGRGSTVCIHEATFDDELQVDAEAKNHSTTSEALGVAQAMEARTCILTHFSQRYQKIPVLDHENGGAGGKGGADVSETLPVVDTLEDEEVVNSEYATDGPLGDDAAATFPDQHTSNGGQQYDIPSKRADRRAGSSVDSGPAAVKLKLASDTKVAVAFDYMRVKVGEIGQMEKFTPALLKLFAEEDDKAEKAIFDSAADAKKSKKGGKKAERAV